MIQDVKTVVSFDTTRLDNSLYVGLMSFTRDQYNAFFDADHPAPGKIPAQFERFGAAYTELDAAYLKTRKSSMTPEIEAADAESDQLVIGIRQVAEGATRMSFDHERQQQATRFYEAMKKYKIDTNENYLAENNKILLWVEEVEGSAALTADAQALGLAAAIAQLKTVAQRLRQLITDRADIPQAAAVIMQYTGYTTVSAADAPTYANCGTSDGIASWRTMQSRLESLSALGIPTEFHSYSGLPHGFGIGTGTVAEGWTGDVIRFWQSQSGTSAIRSTRAMESTSKSIYSLNGTRRDSMQKGINIVDGRKVVKK